MRKTTHLSDEPKFYGIYRFGFSELLSLPLCSTLWNEQLLYRIHLPTPFLVFQIAQAKGF